MTLEEIHETFAWVPVISNGLVGLWALAAVRWPTLRHRALWVATALAQISLFVQVGLGVALLQDGRPNPEMHTFYGFVALITVGLVYGYRTQLADHRHLLYGGTGLFLMGLGIRAMILG